MSSWWEKIFSLGTSEIDQDGGHIALTDDARRQEEKDRIRKANAAEEARIKGTPPAPGMRWKPTRGADGTITYEQEKWGAIPTIVRSRKRDPVTGAVILDAAGNPIWEEKVVYGRATRNGSGEGFITDRAEGRVAEVERKTRDAAAAAATQNTGPAGKWVDPLFQGYQGVRGQQLGLANTLMEIGLGRQPTVAERLSRAAQDQLRAQTLSQLQASDQTPGAQRAALLGLSSGSAKVAQQSAIAAAQEKERYLEAARTALGNIGIQDTQALSAALGDQGQGKNFASDMGKLGLGYATLDAETALTLEKIQANLYQIQEASRLQELGYDVQERIAYLQDDTNRLLGFLKTAQGAGQSIAAVA